MRSEREYGNGIEHDVAKHAVDDRDRADAKRQRDHRDRGEAGRSRERADAVADVPAKIFQPREPSVLRRSVMGVTSSAIVTQGSGIIKPF